MSAPDRADPEPGAPSEIPLFGGPRAQAAPGDELMLVQPAVAALLPPLRRSVRRWLTKAGWPLVATEDIELAVNEAVANIIDHAHLDNDPGPIHLHAWITTTPTAPPTTSVSAQGPRPAVPVVAAPGFPATAVFPASAGFPAAAMPVPSPPRPPPAESTPQRRVATIAVSDRGRWSPEGRALDPGGHRGHGLGMMTGLTAAVRLQRAARGTTVVLVSHPTPPRHSHGHGPQAPTRQDPVAPARQDGGARTTVGLTRMTSVPDRPVSL